MGDADALRNPGRDGDLPDRIRAVLDASPDAQLVPAVAHPRAASPHHPAKRDEGFRGQSGGAVSHQPQRGCAV